MQVVLIGVSHKTAPVEVRERLAWEGAALEETLHALRDAAHVSECAILSTCNRTEIYACSAEEDWQERLLSFLSHHSGVSAGSLQEHVYSFEGAPAVRHLFRVAAGLDSMVVGEGQILAQVREGLARSRQAGTAGSLVGGLLESALAAGKRVRTDTEIGRGAVSVSLAAVQLARQIFGNLNRLKVLLVGAGETTELTARMLIDGGAEPAITVCNRTYERAVAVAVAFGGVALPFEKLTDAISQADVVISSTGASEPVIRREHVDAAIHRRRGQPIFIIDIAVPRDVEPAVNELDDVYLYNIDDLQAVVEESMAGRQQEAQSAEPIVEEEVAKFQTWLRSREVGPTIGDLQRWADELETAEWERVGGRLSHLSERDRKQVGVLLRGLKNKLLRRPILHLREAADSGNGYHEVESIRDIFDLGEGPAGKEDGGAS